MTAKIEKQQPMSGKPIIKCPTCGAPADSKARPFCSRRCADVDLGHWLHGKYAIPLVEAADDTIIEDLTEYQNILVEDDFFV